MKKLSVLVWFLLALGYHAISQSIYEVEFTYDAAGNRTKINVICLLTEDNSNEELFNTEESLANKTNDEEQLINDQNGFSDNISDLTLTIYPNPTKGLVYYHSTAPENAEGTVIISDANGRVVKNTRLKANGTLDFSRFSNGIYFVRITLNGDNSYWKIIKQ